MSHTAVVLGYEWGVVCVYIHKNAVYRLHKRILPVSSFRRFTWFAYLFLLTQQTSPIYDSSLICTRQWGRSKHRRAFLVRTRDTCMHNFGRVSVPSVTVISCILVCGKEMQPLWPRSWVSLFDFYFSIKSRTYLTHLSESFQVDLEQRLNVNMLFQWYILEIKMLD